MSLRVGAGWSRWGRGLLLAGTACALASCLGGQTGTEGEKDVGEGGGCRRVVSGLGPDQSSPFGFTPAELVAAVGGERTASLVWREPTSFVSFGPEMGTSSIRLVVAARATGARFVQWEQPSSGIGIGCPEPSVEVDADVSITSAGGALAERVSVALSAHSTTQASLRTTIPLTTIQGALTVSLPAGSASKGVNVSAVITPTGTSGSLSGILETVEGNSASATFFTYACWPADGAECLSGP